MRSQGDVVYANIDKYGDGVVEYKTVEGMENAIRKLDDTKFENSRDSVYIRVKPAHPSSSSKSHKRSSRSRSRSGSTDSRDDRRRSNSRSRSVDSRDKRSRSRSPSVDKDRSEKSGAVTGTGSVEVVTETTAL